MDDISKISVPAYTSIQDALKIFGTHEGTRLLIINDEMGNFLGIVTDPDIRRGLSKGLSLQSPIELITKRHPITAHIKDSKQKLISLSAKYNIYEVPLLDDSGRVVRVESISSLLKAAYYKNTVVIMAGGLGKRLRPLTDSIPKPMLKVGSKPILQIILERFRAQGFRNVILCVNYKSHIIEDFFGDGSHFDLCITYVREEQALGTAGALSLINRDDIGELPFFVMNGDILSDMDFTSMLAFHSQENSHATMGVREFSYQIPYGVVEVDGNTISNIIEKPTQKFLVSAGIYLLEPCVLNLIPKNCFFDMPSLFERIFSQKDYNARSYLITDYWIDIGRHEEYERANSEYGY